MCKWKLPDTKIIRAFEVSLKVGVSDYESQSSETMGLLGELRELGIQSI